MTEQQSPPPETSGATPRRLLRPLLVLLGLAVVAVAVILSGPSILPPPPEETGEQQAQEMGRAFDAAQPPPTGVEKAAVDALLTTLAQQIRDGKPEQAMGAFHLPRMLQEFERMGILTRVLERQRRAFSEGLQRGILRSLSHTDAPIGWREVEVKHIRPADLPGEIVIYTRHRSERRNATAHFRWWLKRTGKRWQIYDYQDLDSGIRFSTMTGILTAGKMEAASAWVPVAAEALPKALAAVNETLEYDEAQRLLAEVAQTDAPPYVRSIAWMLTASVHVGQQRYPEAIAACDRAIALYRETPNLMYLRAEALYGLQRYRDTIEAVQRYQKLVGTEAHSSFLLGESFRALGHAELAENAYRKGLKDDPWSEENLFGLGLVLPPARKGEIIDCLAAFANPSESLGRLALRFLDAEDDSAVTALARAYPKLAPEDPNGTYFAAQAHLLREEYEQAARLALAAADTLPDSSRHAPFLQTYLDAMLALQQPLEAYRTCPDREFAFAHIGQVLVEAEDPDLLAALLDAHRAAAPEDLRVAYFTGQLALLRQDYPKAIGVLVEAWGEAQEEELREQLREAAVYAFHRGGRSLDAYRTLPPAQRTFVQLAKLLSVAKDADTLLALVDAHRAAAPDDPLSDLWFAEAQRLRGEYEAALQTLGRFRERLGGDPHAYRRHDFVLVHCLVRLGRMEDAMTAAAASTADDGDPYFEVVVHAASGHVAETARLLKTLADAGYTSDEFYADSLLGTALRSEPFAAVRAQFPPPEKVK